MKQKYRELCLKEPSVPIFSTDWWLDTVAGADNWDVVIVERGGDIAASMPYFIHKRCGFMMLVQPPLTQTLGPWLKETGAKHAKRLSREKDLLDALIEGLPTFDHLAQRWHFTRTNWLPFYWRGFKQTTRYTYRLSNLHDKKLLWDSLQSNIRTDIKKARERFGLTVRTDLGMEDFIPLNEKVFQRQGKRLPYSRNLLNRLDSACCDRNSRRIFIAEDKSGQRHAGVYLVWDRNSAYYLMGGGDPQLRISGATSLCLWEAILFAATVSNSFDFEGSMIEPVERFCRAFGAEQTPYFAVSKTRSLLLRGRDCARNLLRRP